MKKLLCCILMVFGLLTQQYAQTNNSADSLLFEQQRQRINGLLSERSARFGDFDESLRKKTGVFGLFKRKKDMQQSLDILRDIVLSDNRIFLETKKLLDIKGGENLRNKNLASASDKQVRGYMRSINNMQQQNEKLQQQIKQLEGAQRRHYGMIAGLCALLIISFFVIFLRPKRK